MLWEEATLASGAKIGNGINERRKLRLFRNGSAQEARMQTDWRWWALGSALFAALTSVLAKIGVAGVSSNLATVVRTGVILFFGVVLIWFTGERRELASLGTRTWLFLVLSGLATGLSWLCYFRALQLGEASRVAPVDKLSVVFVILLAATFLGEKLSWHQWIGGSLILLGTIVIAWKPG